MYLEFDETRLLAETYEFNNNIRQQPNYKLTEESVFARIVTLDVYVVLTFY